MTTRHVLSDIDKTAKTGTCLQCGPNATIQSEGSQWRCKATRRGKRTLSHIPSAVRSKAYTALLEAQGGLCAICGKTEDRALAMDHCHATDTIRGLLCSRCNMGLGMFNEDVDTLKRAIAYLSVGHDPLS